MADDYLGYRNGLFLFLSLTQIQTHYLNIRYIWPKIWVCWKKC